MIRIIGKVQALSSESFDDIVDSGALNDFKTRHPDTVVKVYTVAHEGYATPRIIGYGKAAVRFLRESVQSAFDSVKLKVQCFDGHNSDNSTGNRHSIAEIVGKGMRNINGKLHTLVAVAFKNKQKADYDVISMESPQWHIDDNTNIVKKIESATGFALGLSGRDKPAFSEAVLRGAVQCFEPEDEPKPDEPEKPENNKGKGTKTMTLEELKQEIKKLGAQPSQLFTSDEIIGQISIGKDGSIDISDAADSRIANILKKKFKDHAIVSAKDFDELKSSKDELDKIKPEYEEVRKSKTVTKLKSDIEKIAKERGLSDAQKNFLIADVNLKSFNSNSENFDTERETYIQDKLEIMKSAVGAVGAPAGDADNPNVPDQSGGEGTSEGLPDLASL